MRLKTLVTLGFSVLPALLATSCTPARTATESQIMYVIDGDTVDLQSGQRVRLLGIDAPETSHDDQTPAQCGADAATQRLAALVDDRQVKVITDAAADQTDRYGRTLAYLEVDGRDVGAQMLEDGLVGAWKPASARSPGRWHQYRRAATMAKTEQRGSWAMCEGLGR